GECSLPAVPDEEVRKRRYDYRALIERWQRVFGQEAIVCRRYEPGALVNGDVVDDFAKTAGIDCPADCVRPPRLNESLDASALEFLRLFNHHIDPKTRGRARLNHLLGSLSKGPLLTIPETELNRFMEQVRASNREIAEAHFGGSRTDSDDPLFA